jgi:hypothetical protein
VVVSAYRRLGQSRAGVPWAQMRGGWSAGCKEGSAPFPYNPDRDRLSAQQLQSMTNSTERNSSQIQHTAHAHSEHFRNLRMNHMTNFEDQPPPAVGAYWIKEEEYSALMKVFDDGVTMPRTWKEWLKIAEEMERGLKAYGHVVMRVHIDPKTFPDWCAAHGTSTGREGRRRFVAAAVTERYGNQT